MPIDASELLSELRKRGLSDERIAVGLGEYLPGNNNHPSAMSVYRWRTGKTKPHSIYRAVLLEYFNKEKENELD